MTILRYLPIEEPPPRKAAQWSLGIAMFAAFIMPFVLLSTNAKYRELVVQATAKFEKTHRDTIPGFGSSAAGPSR